MYEATTHGIRVKVEPQFLEHESDPDAGRYFWAYTIEITNESARTVKLRTRYWQITDAAGRTGQRTQVGAAMQLSGRHVVENFVRAG